MARRIAVAVLAVLVFFPPIVAAQQSNVHVGAALNGVTQPRSDSEPLGGTALGGSVVFGVQVSRRVAVEFEPSFGGPHSWEYRYRPNTTSIADVVATRRDAFYPLQVRTRVGVLEPVVGVGYLHAKVSRHATIGGATYFDDRRTDHGLVFVGGLDAAVRLSRHVHFVPTCRLLAGGRWTAEGVVGDPLGNDTSASPFVVRYGAGVRVTF